MEKLKALLEKQSQIWLIIIGLVLMGFGIYQFLELAVAEEAGQVVKMKRILELIYRFGGKYTLLALFEGLGILCLVSGIVQLKVTSKN